MDKILEQVKTALRIKSSTAYDDELTTYINACLYDLDRLNIKYSLEETEPEIITIIIVYVKSKFGNNNADYKDSMWSVYENLRTTLLLDASHRS